MVARHGLDGPLGELGLLVEVIPAVVDVPVAEVANELVPGPRDVAHEGALQHADEGDELHQAGRGDGVGPDQGGDAVGEGVERVAGQVDVAREVPMYSAL